MHYGQIWTDYDGVCCDFERGVEKLTGSRPEDWKDMDQAESHRRLAQACDSVEFWANLDPMPDFDRYWSYIKYWKPGVITAYPQWSKQGPSYAIKGKGIWNRKHTMVPESKFHVVQRSQKKQFAMTGKVPNILIDDHPKNITEWEAAGGTGILHTSALSTIIRLKSLGFTK